MASKAPKTQPTGASVSGFIAKLTDPRVRADCRTLVALMRWATGEKPRMWGSAAHPKLLARLGPHKTGKGCLPLRSLEGVDTGALEDLLAAGLRGRS